jgi:hypothetical protein
MISGKLPSSLSYSFAENLVECFPRLSTSEISAAIQRGIRGEFGPAYLLNGTVLYDWVKKHTFGTQHKYDHTRIKEHESFMDRIKRNKIDPRDTEELRIFFEEEDKHPSSIRTVQDRFADNPEEFPYVKD